MRSPITKQPESWTLTCDADGIERYGACGAELTGMVDLSGWPAGMRVVVRKGHIFAALVRNQVLRPPHRTNSRGGVTPRTIEVRVTFTFASCNP